MSGLQGIKDGPMLQSGKDLSALAFIINWRFGRLFFRWRELNDKMQWVKRFRNEA